MRTFLFCTAFLVALYGNGMQAIFAFNDEEGQQSDAPALIEMETPDVVIVEEKEVEVKEDAVKGSKRPQSVPMVLIGGSIEAAKKDQEENAESLEEAKDDPRAVATHKQSSIIKIALEDEKKIPLYTICLDAEGNILAGVGSADSKKSGEIRKFDKDGKHLISWKVPVRPDAIGVGPDGSVYVGGGGKLVKLDKAGEVLFEKDAPHVGSLKNNKEKLRKTILEQNKNMLKMYEKSIERYEKRIEKLEAIEEEDRTERDEKKLKMFKRGLESMKKFQEQMGAKELTEEEIDERVESMIQYKQKVSSISASGGDVFVSCSGTVGYGYSIWRTNEKLEEGEEIVTGLRGCCGQMDVQSGPNGIYVAENSRHRVGCYDREGELTTTWGKTARKGLTGFGSCCNPMNVAFGPKGEVFTAEASTGRIKRYSPEGELLGLVGMVEIVPGCKNVAIAVSNNGDRIYMMDLTRSHIVMMQRIPSETKEEQQAENDE